MRVCVSRWFSKSQQQFYVFFVQPRNSARKCVYVLALLLPSNYIVFLPQFLGVCATTRLSSPFKPHSGLVTQRTQLNWNSTRLDSTLRDSARWLHRSSTHSTHSFRIALYLERVLRTPNAPLIRNFWLIVSVWVRFGSIPRILNRKLKKKTQHIFFLENIDKNLTV